MLSLFRQLILHPFVENAAVFVEKHRNLAAVAVIPVAVLGVKVPHLLGGEYLAVTAGVPAARRRHSRKKGITPKFNEDQEKSNCSH